MSLLIGFHFFFLVFPLGLVRQFWLVFVAIKKRGPRRVSAIFTVFQLFVSGTFGLHLESMIVEKIVG